MYLNLLSPHVCAVITRLLVCLLQVPPITRRPLDMFFLIFFVFAFVLAVFRGLVSYLKNYICLSCFVHTITVAVLVSSVVGALLFVAILTDLFLVKRFDCFCSVSLSCCHASFAVKHINISVFCVVATFCLALSCDCYLSVFDITETHWHSACTHTYTEKQQPFSYEIWMYC